MALPSQTPGQLTVQVSLPSGRCATVSAPLRSRVLDLKLAAQQALEHGFLKLLGAKSMIWLSEDLPFGGQGIQLWPFIIGISGSNML